MESTNPHSRRAFFCDRDGIVNRRIVGGYVTSPSEFELIPEFPQILRLFVGAGFVPILITNQQGVGKGLMTTSQLDQVHQHMQNELRRTCDVAFTEMYACTKLRSDSTNKRKPKPDMLFEAAAKFQLDLSKSYMLGDMQSDADAAAAAGTTSILIPDPEAINPRADIVVRSHTELINEFDHLIH